MYNIGMDSDTQHRDAFVIYVPNMGFLKNKTGNFVSNFTGSRLFGRRSDAENCIKMNNIITDNAVVIPVQMTLDPKQIFKAVLKGS